MSYPASNAAGFLAPESALLAMALEDPFFTYFWQAEVNPHRDALLQQQQQQAQLFDEQKVSESFVCASRFSPEYADEGSELNYMSQPSNTTVIPAQPPQTMQHEILPLPSFSYGDDEVFSNSQQILPQPECPTTSYFKSMYSQQNIPFPSPSTSLAIRQPTPSPQPSQNIVQPILPFPSPSTLLAIRPSPQSSQNLPQPDSTPSPAHQTANMQFEPSQTQPRAILPYSHSLPPYHNNYSPTVIDLRDTGMTRQRYPFQRGNPPIHPQLGPISHIIWDQVYFSADAKLQKHYADQGCDFAQVNALRLLDRQSGLTRWIAICMMTCTEGKWKGMLPIDFWDNPDDH